MAKQQNNSFENANAGKGAIPKGIMQKKSPPEKKLHKETIKKHIYSNETIFKDILPIEDIPVAEANTVADDEPVAMAVAIAITENEAVSVAEAVNVTVAEAVTVTVDEDDTTVPVDATEENLIASLQRPRGTHIIDISSTDSSVVSMDGHGCTPWMGNAFNCTLYACQFVLLFFFIGLAIYGLSFLLYHVNHTWM